MRADQARPSLVGTGLRAGLGRLGAGLGSSAAVLARGPGPVGPDSGRPHTRVWRALFSGIWLLYLIQPGAALFDKPHGWVYATSGMVLLVAFCVVYLLVIFRLVVVRGERGQSRAQAWSGFAALFALAAAITVAYHGTGLWIFVAAAAGLTIFTPRIALRVVGAAVVGYVITTLSIGDGIADFAITLVTTAVVGLAMIGFRRQIELTRDLSLARETVARLAASEERLRLARDMHDLTGQSLSTITLKCDLAARMLGSLPPSAERDRARAEIEQVADVSRQALRDVREALSGYRRPTLAVEVITARSALEAAGIVAHDDAALTLLSGAFDADAEAALAWCLREAVTNVIRHSRARNCWLRLTHGGAELALEVRDDGVGAGGTEPGADAAHSGAYPGGHSGLRGMSERLSAVGGTLEIRPSTGGFTLLATVPAGESRDGRAASRLEGVTGG
jgi:two-component system sensor histidine kinase DesK